MRSVGEVEFHRTEIRHRRLKTRGDCGHLIDGSRRHGLTPYRYTVWKVKGERGVQQLVECEACGC